MTNKYTRVMSLAFGALFTAYLVAASYAAFDFESVNTQTVVQPAQAVQASQVIQASVTASLQPVSQTTQASNASFVSETFSEVTPTDQVVRMGRENGEIEVILRDAGGRPISGHSVQLISSRGADSISTSSGATVSTTTDANGIIVFEVNSTQAGISSYTVYDLTQNKVLPTRAKVVYFDSSSDLFGTNTQAFVGQNAVIGHAAGSSSGAVSYLTFKDLPQSVSVGQNVSFTLSATDQSQQIVMDYAGTVHFSVTSGSAAAVKLPSDYTFTIQDVGSHTFSLALSFNSPGTYIIEARDTVTTTLFGTLTATVTSSSGSASDLIKVTNPVSGVFSNNVQAVSGTSTPGSKLKIYDNNVEVGSVSVDTTGNFMFVTSPMADGDHELYVAMVNDAGVMTASSEKVKFKIDTTPPKLEKVEFVPDGVAAGAQVEARVYTEAGLIQVLLGIGDNVYDMKDSSNGYYSASFKAPATAGTYPSKITLVDAVGNQTKLDKEKSLTVGVAGALGIGNLPGSGNAGSGTALGDVTSVIAYPTDHKVTLSWKAPTSGSPVQFYRIYYGLAPTQLKFVVDTFNANTSWYIPDLKNGTAYYFAVVAIDNAGNSSAHMSNIATTSPATGKYLPPDVANGTAGKEQISSMKSDVSETGPEETFIFGLAVLGGLAYAFFSRKSSFSKR